MKLIGPPMPDSSSTDYYNKLSSVTFQTVSITLGITIHSSDDSDSSERFESLFPKSRKY